MYQVDKRVADFKCENGMLDHTKDSALADQRERSDAKVRHQSALKTLKIAKIQNLNHQKESIKRFKVFSGTLRESVEKLNGDQCA